MYSDVHIRRFRCFKELKLEGLKQVNLVTGLNNAGKTSFLEALFLLIGGFNPSLPLVVNALRGMDTRIPNSEERWGWLFYNHEVGQTIEIAAKSRTDGQDSLRVHLGSPREFELLAKGEQELPVSLHGTTTGSISTGVPSTMVSLELSDLILEFKEHRGQSVISRVSMESDGRVKLEPPKQNGFRPGAFLATRVRPAKEDAERLSQLKRARRDSQVIKALQAIEPKLKDLTILVLGGESIIHAEIGGVGLIPVPMLGEGLGRLLSLTLAILTTPGGLVLVDEIENGVHHSVLSRVWDGLAIAASQPNTQLIATTHSAECLQAAHQVFAKRENYDLGIVQLFRLPEGIQGRVLGRKQVEAALAGEIDLR